jgi:hypothetical protein
VPGNSWGLLGTPGDSWGILGTPGDSWGLLGNHMAPKKSQGFFFNEFCGGSLNHARAERNSWKFRSPQESEFGPIQWQNQEVRSQALSEHFRVYTSS